MDTHSGTAWAPRISALLLGALASSASSAGIIWSGDFSTGNFTQYHKHNDKNVVAFPHMPRYGSPRLPDNLLPHQSYAYSGDGSLLSLVTSPTRGGPYAAKFVSRNSKSGSEPADCDPTDGVNCGRRRTQLQMWAAHCDIYNAFPMQQTRWISVSFYLPEDWETSGSGMGVVLLGSKQRISPEASGHFQIQLNGDTWEIHHRWSDVPNPSREQIPSQQHMYYAGDYPNSRNWPQGLTDFPDSESQEALGHVNRGGWTDWIFQVRNDHRGSAAGGGGFLNVWKREDSGKWIQVLHVTPKKTTRNGLTFDHGIGYNLPAEGSSNGGFGLNVGLYMDKDQVWNNEHDRVIYVGNFKVGDEKATFKDMSHDGSSPDGGPVSAAATPEAPGALTVE
jgi:hypothetical protein